MNITIRQCKFKDIKHLKSILNKERVTLIDSKNTIWWGAYFGENIVGITAATINNKVSRFKSDYVLMAYRMMGIYQMLFTSRLEYVILNNVERITAFCTNNSLPMYLKNGFIAKTVNSNNITFVERLLYK